MQRGLQGRTAALLRQWRSSSWADRRDHALEIELRRAFATPQARRSFSSTPTLQRRLFSTMENLSAFFSPERSPPPSPNTSQNLGFRRLIEPSITEDDGEALLTRRIHLIGVGAIGILVAHSLATLPNPPPMSLLLHREALYTDFKIGDRNVRLTNKKTEVTDEQKGYDIDLQDQPGHWKFLPHLRTATAEERGGENKPPYNVPGNPRVDEEILPSGETFIWTLICTVKGPATESAMRSIQHRVDKRTTILFMQNGLGQIDELNRKVFTNPDTRPTYMVGVISHGSYMIENFHVAHAGFGTIALGVYRDKDKYPLPPPDVSQDLDSLPEADRKKWYPTDVELYAPLSSRYLLRTLTRCPTLAAAAYPALDLFQLQLEKLVVNCVLNPLTAILEVQNGRMLTNPEITSVQRMLIAEIAVVIRALPELEGVPNARFRFSPARLEQVFRGVAEKTALNFSSTFEDIRLARYPEMDYMNGYIVRRGEELGIRCVLNYMAMQLVKSKTWYIKDMGSKSQQPGESSIQGETTSDGGVTIEDIGTDVVTRPGA